MAGSLDYLGDETDRRLVQVSEVFFHLKTAGYKLPIIVYSPYERFLASLLCGSEDVDPDVGEPFVGRGVVDAEDAGRGRMPGVASYGGVCDFHSCLLFIKD